jgi:HEAT repeat protein
MVPGERYSCGRRRWGTIGLTCAAPDAARVARAPQPARVSANVSQSMEAMPDLREHVADYVRDLSGPARDDAWHSLVEVGPDALPYLIEAFHVSSDASAKLGLARVIAEYRSEDALPFFAECLRNAEPDIWKAALDGLVSLGGRATLDILTIARNTSTPDRREWIAEAVEQIREAEGPG